VQPSYALHFRAWSLLVHCPLHGLGSQFPVPCVLCPVSCVLCPVPCTIHLHSHARGEFGKPREICGPYLSRFPVAESTIKTRHISCGMFRPFSGSVLSGETERLGLCSSVGTAKLLQ
jgi:hypothetical protein